MGDDEGPDGYDRFEFEISVNKSHENIQRIMGNLEERVESNA